MSLRETFHHLGRREKGLAWAAGATALLSAYGLWVLGPAARWGREATQGVHKEEGAWRETERLVGDRERLRARWAAVARAVAGEAPRAVGTASAEERSATFLSDIARTAREAGVARVASLIPLPPRDIVSLSPLGERVGVRGVSVRELPVQVQLYGSLDALVGFLHRISGSARLYRVERCALSADVAESGVLSAQVTVSTVWLAPAPDTPPGVERIGGAFSPAPGLKGPAIQSPASNPYALIVQRDLFHTMAVRAAAAPGVSEKTAEDIRASLSLAAIVFNGRESLALIEERERGGQAFYRVGDEVGGTRIVSINDAAGEVTVDYKGRLRVALRLAGTPPTGGN